LGVTEADVIATLEKGELKGKRIGSQWRITREVLDEFLKS
jgi:excisionase family DNA binding protein